MQMLTNPTSHRCRKQISHRYEQHSPLLHFWQGGSVPIFQNSVVAAPRETTCITRTTHSLSFSRHTSSTSTLMSSILLQSLAGPTTKQRGPLRSEPSSFYHIRRPLWGDDLKRIPVPSRQVPTRNRLHGIECRCASTFFQVGILGGLHIVNSTSSDGPKRTRRYS
jgi:hypothetical protein